ncbi:MAG TPA: PilX N-terminal domain-containing pilus assembly protein [Vicinamibacterales bacterium]|nr:PilX N-terminal domain-containing pilus assembly protein [Vicinamibacterales bacterium]
MTRAARQIRGERGTALFLAIMLVTMLAAIGSAAILASHTETLISASFRQGREARYVADGGVSRAIADLAGLPDWSAALSGLATSTFVDGPPAALKTLPGGGTALLCCSASSLTASLQLRGNGGGDWGPNTPQWKIYGWGRASAWRGEDQIQSAFYVAVWVADDAGDGDGDPARDSNGTVVLNGVALGPRGTRRAVQAVVQRAVSVGGAPGGVRLRSWRESRW